MVLCIISFNALKITMDNSFITLLLQMMKLGHREVKRFFQSHTAVISRE